CRYSRVGFVPNVLHSSLECVFEHRNWTAKPQRYSYRVNIPVCCQPAEVRPRSAGDGRAGAFFVGDRLAHSTKIPLILPIVLRCGKLSSSRRLANAVGSRRITCHEISGPEDG